MEYKNRKGLPVGIESFEEIRKEGYYYVDKTAMLKDLLYRRSKVNLFTRPRRFGKSLNMSMLKCFLEIGCDKNLFDGLKISGDRELCEQYMGKFPVISISLEDVDGVDFKTARSLFCAVIGNEAMRFQFLLDDNTLSIREREQYKQIIHVDQSGRESFFMSDSVLMGSLKMLSGLLEKHYGQKVILLVDEYDVPLAKAHEHGYYNEMVLLLRNVLQQALKTNDSLYFAVLTGCLRVAKESIFTGLNNLKILSITTVRFDEYFGFTDEEVKQMLEYYGLEKKYETVRDWYDGYRFGNISVYCSWDVTDSGLTKSEIEALVAGENVAKEIHEELTYNRLYDSIDHIWSVLFMTGYLTYSGKPEGKTYLLKIPNMEIRNIFLEQIMTQFKADVAKDGEYP